MAKKLSSSRRRTKPNQSSEGQPDRRDEEEGRREDAPDAAALRAARRDRAEADHRLAPDPRRQQPRRQRRDRVEAAGEARHHQGNAPGALDLEGRLRLDQGDAEPFAGAEILADDRAEERGRRRDSQAREEAGQRAGHAHHAEDSPRPTPGGADEVDIDRVHRPEAEHRGDQRREEDGERCQRHFRPVAGKHDDEDRRDRHQRHAVAGDGELQDDPLDHGELDEQRGEQDRGEVAPEIAEQRFAKRGRDVERVGRAISKELRGDGERRRDDMDGGEELRRELPQEKRADDAGEGGREPCSRLTQSRTRPAVARDYRHLCSGAVEHRAEPGRADRLRLSEARARSLPLTGETAERGERQRGFAQSLRGRRTRLPNSRGVSSIVGRHEVRLRAYPDLPVPLPQGERRWRLAPSAGCAPR